MFPAQIEAFFLHSPPPTHKTTQNIPHQKYNHQKIKFFLSLLTKKPQTTKTKNHETQ